MILKILYIHSTQIDSAKANLIQVLSMCNAFEKNDVSVELVLPKPLITIDNIDKYINDKFGIEIKFNIIFYEKFSNNRIIEKYFGVKSVEKILKETKADYVFTRLPKFISLVLKNNKKLIFESHNSILHNKYKLLDSYWKQRILKSLKDKNFVSFISISENLTKYWASIGVNKKKQLSLHDGFAEDLFDKIKSKEDSRKALNISLNEKVVMYIGSLYPDREIENILVAAKSTPNLKYYIIGGPKEMEDKYRAMAVEMNLNNIKFLGYIPHNNVPLYLSTADYLLALWSRKVPTINYCSPLKVFEYMASGNLIIAHDFPTIREVLTEGKTTFFVNPDEKNDLGNVLKKVVSINTSKIAAKSKKVVYDNYTWEKRAQSIIQNLKDE